MTKQLEHSPAPWRTVTDGISHWVEINDKIIMVTKDNAEANARLIAAAPELLGALEGMLEVFADGDNEDMATISKARASIKKAKE